MIIGPLTNIPMSDTHNTRIDAMIGVTSFLNHVLDFRDSEFIVVND
jgi:hypothetical protein